MGVQVDYFFTPTSPWSYLGTSRLIDLVQRHDARLRVVPCDFAAIMAQSGGLPVGKRAPQRQAYRLAELRRWRDHLGTALVIEPRFFPATPHLAARAIIAADQAGHDSLGVALALGRAIWAEERNIADPQTVAAVLETCGLDGNALVARAQQLDDAYAANTREAIACGVFGAPTFICNGEMFWGQDRLAFLERTMGGG